MATSLEVVALYEYSSDVEGDLTFSPGDCITVTEDIGEWYRGFIGSRSGIFPGNFVRSIDEEQKVSRFVILVDSLVV